MKKFLFFAMFFVLCGTTFFADNSLAADKVKNEYIEQFYKQKDSTITLEEEAIILEGLESFWQEDLKVAEILAGIPNNKINPLIKAGETKIKKKNLTDIIMSIDVDDKVNAIQIIKGVYEDVNPQEQSLLYGYVERHTKGTNNQEANDFLETLNNKKAKEKENMFSIAAAYNGTGAGNWAYSYYNYYSVLYPKFTGSFGTNCTNFVSQAMHTGGGLPKQGDWTIRRKNTTYHVINSAAELDYSFELTDPSPWISVVEFSRFWKPKSTVRGATNAQYTTNTSNYRTQKVGDILIFHKGVAGVVTVPTHLMIITQVTASDYNLAGNSNERQAYPLKSAITAYSFIEFVRPN